MEDVVGDVALCQRNTRNSNMLDSPSGCRGVSQIKDHCHTGRLKFAGQDLNVGKLSLNSCKTQRVEAADSHGGGRGGHPEYSSR